MAGTIKDFIGRSVTHSGMRFIPMLGVFAFGHREILFEDDSSHLQLPKCFDQEPDLEDWLSWWAKARMVHLFGIHPPVSCCLTRPLEFLLGVIPSSDHSLDAVKPMLITSIPDSLSFGLRFEHRETKESATRIADIFFDLMLANPYEIGVFSDYFVRLWDPGEANAPSSHEVALYRISCDGTDFTTKFIGYLRPEKVSDDEIDEMNDASREDSNIMWIRDVPVWPFTLPTKRRNNGMHTKHSVVRF